MRHVIMPLVVLLAAAGCSSGKEPDPFGPTEEVSSELLCAYISTATVREIFGDKYKHGKPTGHDGRPECTFEYGEPDPGVPSDYGSPVRVLMSQHKTVADPVGEYFGDDRYEEVTGLGDAAGFGPRNAAGYDLLLVVVDVEGGQRYIEIENEPADRADAERTRPIAEEILDGLSS